MSFLEERLQSREANNLDFLRFLAAALVVLNHCFPLLGYKTEPWLELTGYEGFGHLGLSIFFFMSGMLITRSWETEPSMAAFLWKRVLRIYPGLLAMSLLCVFVVGPLMTVRPLATYLADWHTYRFLGNALAPAYAYRLPGVFEHNPSTAVNGSLWTLPKEFACYAGVLVCGRLGLLTRKIFPWIFAAALAQMLWPYAVLGWHGEDLTKCCLSIDRFCYVYFLLGAAAYVYRRHVPVNGWLALLAIALYLGTLSTGFLGYAVSFVSVPYLILHVALAKVSWLKNWARWGDLSYGMYIYAFPVQQSIIYCFGIRKDVGTLFVSTLLITAVIAYFSWHLVERPAIAGWRGGKGRRSTALPLGGAPALRPAG